jgi:hypothetical protein
VDVGGGVVISMGFSYLLKYFIQYERIFFCPLLILITLIYVAGIVV